MTAEIHALFKFALNPYGGVEVDTTSSSGSYRELSPFVLGPIATYLQGVYAQNFENLWQFSKVYKKHLGLFEWPSPDWEIWKSKGWRDESPHRYPMSKGAVPEYSYWNGKKLGYIDARKQIYAPVYAKHVRRTESFKLLKQLYLTSDVIVLRDYDAYDHLKLGMSLVDVINDPNRKMGHAFVLMMILTGVLDNCINSPTP